MMDGKSASGVTNDVGAGNPNAAASEFISDEIKAQPAIFPDKATLSRLEPLDETSPKVRRLLNKLWTEIKIR
jgi:spermidine/putrescine transport system substrate-binding protein